MKSPLLQQPLPVMKRALPAISITKDGPTHTLGVAGIGERLVPRLVAEAITELGEHGMWEEMGYHCIGTRSQPGVTPRPDIAVLALMLRHDELNYVEFAPAQAYPGKVQ